MSVEINAPTRASAGDVLDPRANNAKEQISGDLLLDWALRGWVFSFGLLSDDTDNVAAMTTLADTTPTLALQSPSGGDTIVIPLRVTLSIAQVAGGLTTYDIVYTKAAAACATVLALTSGITMTGVINHLTTNPLITPRATIQRTVTASALLVTDSIVIAHKELPVTTLTTTFQDPTYDYVFSEPLCLVEGAALLVYAYSATTANEIRPSITWAEIPASVYKP